MNIFLADFDSKACPQSSASADKLYVASLQATYKAVVRIETILVYRQSATYLNQLDDMQNELDAIRL